MLKETVQSFLCGFLSTFCVHSLNKGEEGRPFHVCVNIITLITCLIVTFVILPQRLSLESFASSPFVPLESLRTHNLLQWSSQQKQQQQRQQQLTRKGISDLVDSFAIPFFVRLRPAHTFTFWIAFSSDVSTIPCVFFSILCHFHHLYWYQLFLIITNFISITPLSFSSSFSYSSSSSLCKLFSNWSDVGRLIARFAISAAVAIVCNMNTAFCCRIFLFDDRFLLALLVI